MTGPVSSHTWIVAAAYLAAGVIGALALRGLFTRLHRRAENARWRGGDIVVAFLRLVTPWCLGVGCVWAAVLALPLRSPYRYDLDHALLALIVVVVSLGSAKVAGVAVHAGATSHAGTSGSATIFVSITRVVVWTIGGLVLLSSLGVAITPLLTALGVGGLAVALALQDTLSNLFAGVHILTSRKVQPGDFIQLDNGMEGYVEDTNWRNTIIRQLPNNLIVVPNATVASSIVTNYHLPEHELSVTIPCGVSYASDLEHVERVAIDVGQEVMHEVKGGVPEHEPTVRYNTFGDFSICFNVGLRAADVSAQALIIHEFIKRLHSRYQREGIDNSSPSVTVLRQEPEPLGLLPGWARGRGARHGLAREGPAPRPKCHSYIVERDGASWTAG
ncbi:MAG TPA: mechanosensitive ion channel family protein [Trebonia sp.]|jgi:small-conductance mechanosensitive channel|nr:mechanosensitive ion channel family protein [Trebonia sp.]